MRIVMSVIVVFASLVVGILGADASEVTFYVSQSSGNDLNPGTVGKPFLTIDRARDAIRELKNRNELGERAVIVYLRGGIYRLPQSFKLGEQDSGTSSAPITYTAYQQEEVRLSGGLELPVDDFQSVADMEELKRLAPTAIPHIRRTALHVRILTKSHETRWDRSHPGQPEKVSPEELYIDDEVMQLARWPNKEWARVDRVSDPGTAGINGRPGSFRLDNPRVLEWEGANVWLKGFWFWDWYDESIAARSIDSRTREIGLGMPLVYGLKAGARYFAFNILSELDHQGEYYIDREASVLYVWPPTPLGKARVTLSSLSSPIMMLEKASHIRIQGLIIEEGRDDGIQIIGGQGNQIRDCLIRNIGRDGVVIQGGLQHVITGSRVYGIGTRGIVASGGDRRILKPAGHRIVANDIHHYGRRIATVKAGIDIDGIGVHVAHNEIHDAPHIGIIFAGNEHIIEFNEVHHVCEETSDAGAIYVGRDWTARGNIIRHNFLHDLFGNSKRNDVTAIYLDDLASGVEILGNVIVGVHRAILIGGGRDNHLENNVLANCDIAISIDARGVTKAFSTMSQDSVLMKRLSAIPFGSPPWSGRYPKLATILQDDPNIPKNNVLHRNIAYRCTQTTINPMAQQYGSIELPHDSDSDLGLQVHTGQRRTISQKTPIQTSLPSWEVLPFPDMGLPK